MNRISWTGFATDDCGAITVDWVVLTAAVIGLGMAALLPVAYGTDNMAQTTGDYIQNAPVGYE